MSQPDATPTARALVPAQLVIDFARSNAKRETRLSDFIVGRYESAGQDMLLSDALTHNLRHYSNEEYLRAFCCHFKGLEEELKRRGFKWRELQVL